MDPRKAAPLGAGACPSFQAYSRLHHAALRGYGMVVMRPPGENGGFIIRRARNRNSRGRGRDPLAMGMQQQEHRQARHMLQQVPGAGAAGQAAAAAGQQERPGAAQGDFMRPRWLVTSDPDGIADRLVNAVSSFYYAMLTNRALCIRPSPDFGAQPGLETAFATPNIDWTCRDAPSPFPGAEAWDPTADDAWLWPETEVYRTFILRDLNTVGPANATTIQLRMHRGLTVALFNSPYHARQLAEIGLRPDNAFGCAVNYLFGPGPEMWALAGRDPTLHALMMDERRVKIGIQIRLGDGNILSQLEGKAAAELAPEAEKVVRGFFQCAEALEQDLALHMGWNLSALADPTALTGTAAGATAAALLPAHLRVGATTADSSGNGGTFEPVAPGAFFYIMTDTLAVRTWASRRYGTKALYMAHSQVQYYQNVSSVGLVATALEHWYFARAHHHVITAHSGMGRTGAFASLRPGPSLFSVDHETGERLHGRGCALGDADRPQDVYNTWSGI